MKFLIKAASLFILLIVCSCGSQDSGGFKGTVNKTIDLPQPEPSRLSLSESIIKRRTVRNFDSEKKMTLQEVSNILYSMQGTTKGSKRAVASAYGVYPLELYLITRNIDGLSDGIYKMNIPEYKLQMFKEGNFSSEIEEACSGQSVAGDAQLKIVITCVWRRLTDKMGKDSRIWGYFEAGEATQNGFLMAGAMGLNTVPVGGMDPAKVASVIEVDTKVETPVIVDCIGR